MVVCLCKGISDKQIRQLVEAGVTSAREVMSRCRAGTDCGTCVLQVRAVVEETLAEVAEAFPDEDEPLVASQG